MKGRAIPYTAEQEKWLRIRSQLPRRDLTARFNRRFGTALNVDTLKAKCLRMGLTTGRTGCFKPGNIPHPNARPKGPNKTSFKKGHKPANTLPIGHVRCHDGYWQIKVFDTGHTKRDFVLCHHLVWQLHHGPVPAGHIIIFIDGDASNIEIENLRCIPRGAHVIINKRGLRNVTPAARQAAITVGEVLYHAGRRAKQTNQPVIPAQAGI